MAHYQLLKCNAVRAFIQKREYLTWPEDPQDLEWFYEKLISKLFRDTKVKKLPDDRCQLQTVETVELENVTDKAT